MIRNGMRVSSHRVCVLGGRGMVCAKLYVIVLLLMCRRTIDILHSYCNKVRVRSQPPEITREYRPTPALLR